MEDTSQHYLEFAEWVQKTVASVLVRAKLHSLAPGEKRAELKCRKVLEGVPSIELDILLLMLKAYRFEKLGTSARERRIDRRYCARWEEPCAV